MQSHRSLNIIFGIPDHGWLPTVLQYEDFRLEVEISDVPIDPMTQLCDALIQINKGINISNRIIWHLEPYCYYLQLRKLDEKYMAIILASDEFDSPTKIVTEISGTFEEIIRPLYSALKKFWSKSFKPPHWVELDSKRIEELTKLIKEKSKS